MKVCEKVEKDTSGRNRLYNYYDSCLNCGKEYKKQKAHAEGAKQEFYCSVKCYNTKNTRINLICSHCGTEFSRTNSELRKRKKNKHINFCSRECKDKAVLYMDEIRPSHYNTSENYRVRAFRELENKCNSCGITDIRVLEVHHKDMDHSNDDLCNLEILCANCHTIKHSSYSS